MGFIGTELHARTLLQGLSLSSLPLTGTMQKLSMRLQTASPGSVDIKTPSCVWPLARPPSLHSLLLVP
jgi:hypothetical protein